MEDLSKQILLQSICMSKGNNRNNRKYQDILHTLLIALKASDDATFFRAFKNIVKDSNVNKIVFDKMYVPSMNALQLWTSSDVPIDFTIELRWQLTLLRTYAEDINGVLEKKKEVEKAIFRCEYKEASGIMDEIIAKYGFSFWALDVYTNIYKNVSPERINEIMQSTSSKIARTLLFYWNLRGTETYPFSSYCNYCKKQIEMLGNQRGVRDYLTHLLIPGNLLPSRETIYSLMEYTQYLSFIDRYFLVLEIMQRILLEGKVYDEAAVIEEYLFLLDDVHDEPLDVIRFFLAKSDTRKEFAYNDVVSDIKSQYISGNIEQARDLLLEFIIGLEDSIEAMILSILMDMNGKIDYYKQIGIEWIQSGLYQILTYADYNGESRESLLRFAYCNSYSKWGRDLYNYIMLSDEAYGGDDYRYIVGFCHRNSISDAMIFSLLTKEEILDYYDGDINVSNLYVRLRMASLKNDYEPVREDIGNEHIQASVNIMRDLSNINMDRLIKLNPLAMYEGIRLYWSGLSESNVDPLDHFVRKYIKNIDVCGLFPFSKFFDLFEQNCFERSSVAVPIVCYAYTSKYIDEPKEMDLVNACDDFFREFHVDRPSELKIDDFREKKEEFIFFLKNVCIPGIMKKVLICIESARMQEIERIRVLEILMEIDPDNRKEYSREIDKRYQNIAINYGVSQVNKGRIYANVTGMKDYLIKELKDDYDAYTLANENGIERILSSIANKKSVDGIEVINLDPKDIMDKMIITIRDTFAYNEAYGLDTYLSINIRHGMLEEKIRAPLAAHGIAVHYRDEKDKWKIGQDWFSGASEYKTKEIIDAVWSFNEGVGNICEDLLKRVVRIQTENKGGNGLVNLNLDEDRLKRIKARLWNVDNLEDIISEVIGFLWEETDKTLLDIRERELSSKLNELNDLLHDFQGVFDNKNLYSSQIKVINMIGDEFVRSIDQIKDWFMHSNDTELPDYTLEDVMAASVSVIKDLHPETKITMECDYSNSSDYKMNSRRVYVTYVSIFQNLLGNAVSYGVKKNRDLKLTYGLQCREDMIDIYMKNDINARFADLIEKKMGEVVNMVGNASYRDNVNSEGGTGLKKSCMMIETDLGYIPNFSYILDKENATLGIHITGSR